MTKAILEMEDAGRFEGEAEAGGDYVRLLVGGSIDTSNLEVAAKCKIKIEGITSEVVIENIGPSTDGRDTVITMRLFKPIG